MDQAPERLRIFVGGRELNSDAALVRNCGLGPGHVMHAACSESTVSLCSLPPSELSRLWEGTPQAVFAGLVRPLRLALPAVLLCHRGVYGIHAACSMNHT